ncbi:MAG: YitT family protein [Vicinamibacterales bacterium]
MKPEPSGTRITRRILLELLNGLFLLLGILSAGMGLKGFLLTSNFVDGGVTGVCMLLSKTTGLPLALCLPLVNFPFIALGWHQIGPAFAIRSVVGIAGLVLALVFVPYPDVTPDLVLTAVFGGLFVGAGIGLAIRGGAVLDGTEVAALLISTRSAVIRVGDVILGFNVVLFLIAMSVIGVDAALYSILTYGAASKTLDFVLHGLDEVTAITIVSDGSAGIRERIVGELGRGVTVYRGYGGKSGAEKDILYCIVTRLEIGKVKSIVREVDADALLAYQALAGAEGGMVRKTTPH